MVYRFYGELMLVWVIVYDSVSEILVHAVCIQVDAMCSN